MAASKAKIDSNIEEVYNTWNETFPELNMRKSDLTNPTEAFLVKTLAAYLRAFGYRVEPPKLEYNNPEKERRIFLIIIARHIEKILQISVKSRSFTYYDLIKPAPKKTVKCLDILYNYLCYFNMFRQDVLTKASDLIQKYEDLKLKLSEVKQETIDRKNRKVEVKSQIESLQREISEMKPRLETMRANYQKRNKDIAQLKCEVEELDSQLSRLNAQKEHYSKLIVPEKERKDLMMQLKKLEEDIKANKEEIKQHEEVLKERKTLIESNNLLCQSITEMLEKLPLKDLAEYKEGKSKLEKATKLHQATKNKVKEMKSEIEKQKANLELIRKNLKTRKAQYEAEKFTQENIIKEKQNALMESNKKLDNLIKQNEQLKNKIAEQDLISENLYQSINELLVVYH